MICMIEPQCVKWQHEMVNAGWLSLIQKNYPNEKILYVSDRKHWECVKSALLENGEDVFAEHVSIEIDTNIKQNRVEEKQFYFWVEQICKRNKEQLTHVIMLSSHRANMRAIARIAKKYNSIRYIVVWHAIAEELFRNSTVQERLEKRTLLKCIKVLLRRPNIRIVSYGPYFKSKLREFFLERKLDNVLFMHHPYLYKDMEPVKKEDETVQIGVIGAGVNADAIDIIEQLEGKVDEKQLVFKIVRSKKKLSDYSLVECIDQGNVISREQLLKILKKLDYILLAYDNSKYTISASGVLFDAINSEIPLITLDSPLLEYYNQYNIGWEFNKKEKIEEFIRQKVIASDTRQREERMNKVANIKALKRKCIEENDNIVKIAMR